MSEKKEGQLPPEEGDLNAEAIKKGLTKDQESSLRRDLEAVESGDGSTESILRGGASDAPRDSFHRDWEIGNERAEMMEADLEGSAGSFHKFLMRKGFSESDFSYNDVYDYFEYGEIKGDPFKDSRSSDVKKAKTAELKKLEPEWMAGLERDKDGRVIIKLE